ncbi:hypothetical protein CLTEP_28060 [Clostridium tepidiprofundi DSM 19306]|uniref:Uncharacterized protein n=1 Tax=Clostridium tepidiprofundi DSM 19306 TaxID=1121338 RepID=A0A151AEE1_9CLOT|nr:hypothetical protein [Clostridium tepidiprofundi]KYH25960.1 hypothetical protein CLTEP_28060 [Clostridium tepidiprofundi DSM 19306]
MSKQINQLTETNQSNKELISTLKNTINDLNATIHEYKNYKSENEELRKLLSDSKNKNIKLHNELDSKSEKIEELNSAIYNISKSHSEKINSLKDQHKTELENLKITLELEKQKSIIEMQQKYQDKIQKLQYDSNKVNEYESRYKELLIELKGNK